MKFEDRASSGDLCFGRGCILVVVLTACTGRGGGQLPPSAGFPGAAPFGFSFSCEDKGGLNPSTGQLPSNWLTPTRARAASIDSPFARSTGS